MNPSTYYRQIAAEITDSDTRKVLQVMSEHIGGNCSIELDDLSQAVFGTVSTSSTRKARMVLEQLVKEYEIPIGSLPVGYITGRKERMKPNEFYLRMAASIKNAEVRLVAALMSDYIGEENAVRLETLCKRASMDERKVRMILEKLVKEYRLPVCAFSGKPGRWLARSYKEALHTKLEFLSRVEEMKARALSYDRCAYPPEEIGEPDFVQPFLVDIPEPEPVPYWERWS